MRAKKLVLKRFTLGQAQPGGPFIDLEGRAPGLLSFFLSVLRIDPTLSLRCFADRVEVVEAGLGGRETVVIPIGKVSSIIGGHSRPLAPLAVAGFFGFSGFLGVFTSVVVPGDTSGAMGGAVFSFFLAAVALVIFYLSRSMFLAVQNGGDKSFGLRFGQGVIEGVDVNPARVQQAVDLLNRATMNANQTPSMGDIPTSGRQAVSA